jgi:predicted RNA methylase
MKKFTSRMAIVLAICVMTSVMAFAKEKTKKITIPQDMSINGTLVKKGTYKMKFDEQTGELSIVVDKNTTVKTAARVEKHDRKVFRTEIGTTIQGANQSLRSITFKGESESIVVGNSSTPTAAAQ